MPWDDDIDILISMNDLDKLLNGLKLLKRKNGMYGKYILKGIRLLI